jgi:PEP-CTERM motif-containing protein
MMKIVYASLFAATLLCPMSAAADTVTLTSNGSTYGWNLGKGDWVTIAAGSSGPQMTAWAGEINWLLTSPTGFTQSLVTYCVDFFNDALHTQTVTVSNDIKNDLTSTTSIGTTPGAGGRAAWLVNTYASEASTNNDKAAGLQIAVWNTMYAAGAFSISAPLAAMNWASTYLGTLGTNTATGIYFDAARGAGQDQIATPEPASILMLLIGMTMALGFGYRRKRQTVIA